MHHAAPIGSQNCVAPETDLARPAGLERGSLGNQHILVLGGGGFLGRAITSALVAQAGRVSTILGPPGADLSEAPRDVRSCYHDICDLQGLASWLGGVDTVIHAAGPPSVAASFAEPLAFARNHVLGMVSTLEACRHAGVRRLVYLSSAEIYGQPAINPTAESAPLAPVSPYGAAKVGAEAFICADAGRSVDDVLILRPFSVYGPGSPSRSVVGSIMRQALEGSEVRVFDPYPVRDYCYIDDLVDCVLDATASTMAARVRIYNVGTGRGTSVVELSRLALKVVDRNVPLRVATESDRPAGSTVRELVADIGHARLELGWSPATPLEQGLAHVVEQLRQRQS